MHGPVSTHIRLVKPPPAAYIPRRYRLPTSTPTHTMNDRDKLREDRLTRVQTFGTENSDDFAAGSKARILFGRIDQHLKDLANAKIGQVPGRASKATILNALWLDFKDIAATSRSIGPADLGGSTADYAMPDDFTESKIKTHAERLLRLLEDNDAPEADGGDTAALKAAKATLRAKFIEWEMTADFIEDIRADYDSLIGANKLNLAENQEGVENTEAITQILLAATKDVDDLETAMRNKYKRQPEKLAAWLAASRVHRAPQREKKPAGGGTSPTSGGATPPK